MPTYVYQCTACQKRQEAFRTIAERDDAPRCERCLGDTERRIVATMVSVFQPYTTPCFDRETGKPMRIQSQSEHRAFLARNGLEEVGNDKSMAPPSPEEWKHRRAEKLKEEQAAREQPAFDFDADSHHAQPEESTL